MIDLVCCMPGSPPPPPGHVAHDRSVCGVDVDNVNQRVMTLAVDGCLKVRVCIHFYRDYCTCVYQDSSDLHVESAVLGAH